MKRVLALLAVIPSLALAQDAPRVITLDETVALALQNSLQMNQQRESLRQRRVAIRTSYLAFFGSVTVNASASERNGLWNYSNGISTGINIVDPATYMAIGDAKRQLESALLSENTARYSIRTTAKRDFYANLQQQEQVTAARAALEIARLQAEQVRARVRSGTAIEDDTLNSFISVSNAEVNLLTAENNLRNSQMTLARTIGSDTPVQANPADTAGFKFIVIDSIALLDALEHGPGMQQTEQSIENAKYSVRQAKIAYLPRLNWNLSLSRNGSGTGFFGYNNDPFNYQTNNNWKNFGLSMTLFDKFARENNLQSRKIALDNARLTQNDTERQLRAQLLQAISGLRTLEIQIKIQELSIKAAERQYNTVLTRYGLGMDPILTLTQSQEQLATQKRNLINQKYTYRNNVAALEQLIGRDLQ